MTNSVITRKIEKCSDQNGKTWPIQRPRIAAWPNMLHGIASGFLGANHFDDMRTNALKALGDHRPGTSHILHLSLVNHPSADPALYAPILTDASRSHSRVQKPGPGHLLLTRLHQLHWHLNMHDTFRDENGDPIDLWHAPVQEVYMRVCEAWQAQVAGCIAKHKTFKGMQHTHAFLSTRRLPTEPMDRSLLRNNLDGTFYTADHLPKRDPGLSDNAHTAAR